MRDGHPEERGGGEGERAGRPPAAPPPGEGGGVIILSGALLHLSHVGHGADNKRPTWPTAWWRWRPGVLT